MSVCVWGGGGRGGVFPSVCLSVVIVCLLVFLSVGLSVCLYRLSVCHGAFLQELVCLSVYVSAFACLLDCVCEALVLVCLCACRDSGAVHLTEETALDGLSAFGGTVLSRTDVTHTLPAFPDFLTRSGLPTHTTLVEVLATCTRK